MYIYLFIYTVHSTEYSVQTNTWYIAVAHTPCVSRKNSKEPISISRVDPVPDSPSAAQPSPAQPVPAPEIPVSHRPDLSLRADRPGHMHMLAVIGCLVGAISRWSPGVIGPSIGGSPCLDPPSAPRVSCSGKGLVQVFHFSKFSEIPM